MELPELPDGTRYRSYSEALRDLAAPAVFENRPTYRLTEADLTKPRLAFTRGRYFDGVDTGEAAAHEYAATRLAGRDEHRRDEPGPVGPRARIADPCDLSRRPANLAITTLTLRFEAASGRAWFLLHWRDPAKVGHAGGMYQVIPVGVFQPSGEASWHEREDFSLWRCMLREFDEELRGSPERAMDYDTWPFARHMAAALDRGQIRAWCLGLGVDPLTYATDLLTVAVIDSRVFDELFSLDPRGNDEGSVLGAGVRRPRHRPGRDHRAGSGGRRRGAAAGVAAPGHADRVTSPPRYPGPPLPQAPLPQAMVPRAARDDRPDIDDHVLAHHVEGVVPVHRRGRVAGHERDRIAHLERRALRRGEDAVFLVEPERRQRVPHLVTSAGAATDLFPASTITLSLCRLMTLTWTVSECSKPGAIWPW